MFPSIFQQFGNSNTQRKQDAPDLHPQFVQPWGGFQQSFCFSLLLLKCIAWSEDSETGLYLVTHAETISFFILKM